MQSHSRRGSSFSFSLPHKQHGAEIQPSGVRISYIDGLRPFVTAPSVYRTTSAPVLVMNASSHQVLETSKPDCQPKGFTNDTKRARRTRPSPYPYRWHNLLLLPQRIRHPRSCAPKGWQDPTLDCPVEAGIESDTCDKQEWHQKTTTTTVIDTAFKVGKPRTLAKTPVNQITLRDVLEG